MADPVDFAEFAMPSRTMTVTSIGEHIDHGLRLFLDSHQTATRAISDLADTLTCYRQQGLHLSVCCSTLANSLITWIQNPRKAGQHDDFVEAVQIDM